MRNLDFFFYFSGKIFGQCGKCIWFFWRFGLIIPGKLAIWVLGWDIKFSSLDYLRLLIACRISTNYCSNWQDFIECCCWGLNFIFVDFISQPMIWSSSEGSRSALLGSLWWFGDPSLRSSSIGWGSGQRYSSEMESDKETVSERGEASTSVAAHQGSCNNAQRRRPLNG